MGDAAPYLKRAFSPGVSRIRERTKTPAWVAKAPLVTPRVTHDGHEAEIRTGELAGVQYWPVSPQRWHVLGERHRPLLKPKNSYGALVPRLICPEPSSLRSSHVPLQVLDHLTMGTNQS